VTPVRVVLAEDHAVVRQGLRALLEKEPGVSVVGEASDGLQVADLVETTKADVLVLDLVMPGLGGLDVAREVVRRSPRTRIVILSMHATEAFVVQAFRSGASAYVLKESTAAELVHAIREARAGRRHLSPPLSDRAIDVYVARAREGELDAYDLLTTRERQVLHLAAEGLSNPAIGERLGISPRTAQTHRAHVMEKLGLRTRRDLIVYAVKRGLFPADAGDVARSDPGDVPDEPTS
jgi:two-component system, NarL family, response regulator NreC